MLQKHSSFMWSLLSILHLRAWAIGILFRKYPPVPLSSRLFPTFSSIRFSVSNFMLKSLIDLDLCFVQGEKYGSVLIFLHKDSQLDQHYSLKMCSFWHCMWFYFWFFNSISLINLSISVPIPWIFYHYCSVALLKVREGGSSRRFLLFSIVSNFLGVLGY